MFCGHEDKSLVKALYTTERSDGSCNDRVRPYGLYSDGARTLAVNNLSSGLWPSQIGEIIDLKPASHGTFKS